MHAKLNLFFGLIILVGFMAGTAYNVLGVSYDQHTVVSVEADLYQSETATMTIVVQATDTATAASAVETVGGQVAGYLQTEHAVLAIISADQLDALVIQPDVRSIASKLRMERTPALAQASHGK